MRDAIKPFTTAVNAAGSAGIPLKTRNSIEWYKRYCAAQFGGIQTFHDVKRTGETSIRKKITIGQIYTFIYSPKHKETLPYYDANPLVIPFSDDGISFYAFNLHYLPIRQRALALDALFKISNTATRGNSMPELNAKYRTVMAMSRSNLFKPCVKRYLKSHVRSRFLEFNPAHWEICIFLPVTNFKKASEYTVYSDSLKSIRGNKRKGRK